MVAKRTSIEPSRCRLSLIAQGTSTAIFFRGAFQSSLPLSLSRFHIREAAKLHLVNHYHNRDLDTRAPSYSYPSTEYFASIHESETKPSGPFSSGTSLRFGPDREHARLPRAVMGGFPSFGNVFRNSLHPRDPSSRRSLSPHLHACIHVRPDLTQLPDPSDDAISVLSFSLPLSCRALTHSILPKRANFL